MGSVMLPLGTTAALFDLWGYFGYLCVGVLMFATGEFLRFKYDLKVFHILPTDEGRYFDNEKASLFFDQAFVDDIAEGLVHLDFFTDSNHVHVVDGMLVTVDAEPPHAEYDTLSLSFWPTRANTLAGFPFDPDFVDFADFKIVDFADFDLNLAEGLDLLADSNYVHACY
eukprot:5869838-Amphidinium_carterae.1